MIKEAVDISKVKREDFVQIKKKWRYYLVGDETNSVDNPVIRVLLDSITQKAVESRKIMNRNVDAQVLFGTKLVEETYEMGAQYAHLWNMAQAYGTYGTPLYKDSQLKEDILYALEWLYTHYYGVAEIDGRGWRSVFLFDWWEWFVKVPNHLCDTLMVLGEELPRSEVFKYLMPFDYIRTVSRLGKTRPYASSRSYATTEAAVLKEDSLLMLQCLEDLDVLLQPADTNGGVMKDYSYINHGVFSMEGMYGTSSLIKRLMMTASILAGTKFEINSEEVYNQFLWMEHTFRPVMHNGAMLVGCCGRGPGEGNSQGHAAVSGALCLLGCFGEEEDKVLKAIIRQNVSEKNLKEVAVTIDKIWLVERLLAVMKEDFEAPAYERGMMRYATDRAVQHRVGPNGKGYAVSLNMSSKRIGRYECINHDNMEGWYQGDGTLYVYTDLTDGVQNEFGDEYFNQNRSSIRSRSTLPYANMHRLPGTTEDMRKREPVSISSPVMGLTDFVGGAELEGQYVAAVLDFEAYHYEEVDDRPDKGYGGGFPQIFSDLTAKKSYFMFDDEIVAVGSDICATNEEAVSTYIDNRALFWSKNPAGGDITVDGCLYKIGRGCEPGESCEPGTICKSDSRLQEMHIWPSWVHLGCFGGYYLPMGGEAVINVTEGERRFFELWISHGKKPQKGTYAYVMLPGRTAEETSAYSEHPDVEILECTEKLHVVKEKKLGITAMVFWEAGTYGDITVDIPCVVMVREYASECAGEQGNVCADGTGCGQGRMLRIAVSDPTWKERKAQMVIGRRLIAKEMDSRIVVDSGTAAAEGAAAPDRAEKTVLTLDFTQTKGETLVGVLYTLD